MKHFKIQEFESPDLKGSGIFMDETFLSMIDDARTLANVPFSINSGYRTKKHNNKVKGNPNSSHLKGLAADIKCIDSRSRFLIINALIDAGFNRIGIANTFIHCDIDVDKSKNVVWVY